MDWLLLLLIGALSALLTAPASPSHKGNYAPGVSRPGRLAATAITLGLGRCRCLGINQPQLPGPSRKTPRYDHLNPAQSGHT